MLQKSSIEKTMEVFYLYPTKNHYLMDISRTINIAHTSTKKNIDVLVKKEIVVKEIEKKGKRNFPIYKANLDNLEFKQKKWFITYLLFLNLI